MATLGTFVSGQVLTAAELNAIGTYDDYVPTFTNITFSSYTARYTRINNLVHCWFSGVLNAAVTGTILITTPTNSAPNTGDIVFAGSASADDDNTGSQTPGRIFVRSGADLQFRTMAVGGTALAWDATEPITWASGDILSFDLTYEAT